MVSTYLRSKRNGLRNQTIFLLSVKCGLRSKEISKLSWKEVCDSNGQIDSHINLTNRSSKGVSGVKNDGHALSQLHCTRVTVD